MHTPGAGAYCKGLQAGGSTEQAAHGVVGHRAEGVGGPMMQTAEKNRKTLLTSRARSELIAQRARPCARRHSGWPNRASVIEGAPMAILGLSRTVRSLAAGTAVLAVL